MKINRIGGISFGLSSFSQQNLNKKDCKKNELEKQSEKDEFVKIEKSTDGLTPQERYKKNKEEEKAKFDALIHKPQKFSIEA